MRILICALVGAVFFGLAVMADEEPIPTYDQRVADGVDRFAKTRAENPEPDETPYFLMERWVVNEVVIDPGVIMFDIPFHANRTRTRGDKLHAVRQQVFIKYLGDDANTPVLGLGIMRIKVIHADDRKAASTHTLARMVRSPRPKGQNEERPRNRGYLAWHFIDKMRAENPTLPLREIVKKIPFERYETTLEKCPLSQKIFAKKHDQKLFPSQNASDFLHADTIELSSQSYLEESRYWGVPAGDTPAAWALELIDALEPCWQQVDGDFSYPVE